MIRFESLRRQNYCDAFAVPVRKIAHVAAAWITSSRRRWAGLQGYYDFRRLTQALVYHAVALGQALQGGELLFAGVTIEVDRDIMAGQPLLDRNSLFPPPYLS